ncbi:hypothetical protein FNV43_RR01160 [Rhamnella rubrinervis]|uniref:Fe2OG dioxygenase domain-containing protein n=1 Tax=Rhamnella rubrinervis TaxID=2594499 RepID=A0A8K0HRZ5_9ROSA|nr:hypothetical protein FNV43_RR01160 [Rhamnella rubrinervis]
MKVGDLLLELLSEALGLNPNHLKDIDCAEGVVVLGHYYPACPQPELCLGASKHSDNSFLTVLLQDHIGGLQVLLRTTGLTYPMSLLISNDRFKSSEHRVLANVVGPRISVATFLHRNASNLEAVWTYKGVVVRRKSAKVQDEGKKSKGKEKRSSGECFSRVKALVELPLCLTSRSEPTSSKLNKLRGSSSMANYAQ